MSGRLFRAGVGVEVGYLGCSVLDDSGGAAGRLCVRTRSSPQGPGRSRVCTLSYATTEPRATCLGPPAALASGIGRHAIRRWTPWCSVARIRARRPSRSRHHNPRRGHVASHWPAPTTPPAAKSARARHGPHRRHSGLCAAQAYHKSAHDIRELLSIMRAVTVTTGATIPHLGGPPCTLRRSAAAAHGPSAASARSGEARSGAS